MLIKNNLYENQTCVLFILNFSIFSLRANFLLKLFGPFEKSKSVVYIVTSCPYSEISRAKSTAKNTIPPNWVAGKDAGHTIAIFIRLSFNYTF